MQLFGVLVLMVTLSSAYGLRCYTCDGNQACQVVNCPPPVDRCATAVVNGVTAKSCFLSSACVGSIKCCDKDLCNSAIPTGSSVLLLMVSSAIITLFL